MTVEDIVQAAFLQIRGHRLVRLLPHPAKSGRVLFEFEDREGITADAQDFLEDGQAGARTLARRIGRLRDWIRVFRGERSPMEQTKHADKVTATR